MTDSLELLSLPIERIFLDTRNPRHVPLAGEPEIIDYLCKRESVLALAQDIARNGLNPLDRIAVIPHPSSTPPQTYVVAEGNRRLCALKLLKDPERSPSNQRKAFRETRAQWTPPSTLECVVFPDRESVQLWLQRIHEGEQKGIGRRKWDADQIARHRPSSRNALALAFLDHAEALKLLTSNQRRRKLTTVQRYLDNELMQANLGLTRDSDDLVKWTLEIAEEKRRFTKFVTDLLTGKVNSRSNKEVVHEYSSQFLTDDPVGETPPITKGSAADKSGLKRPEDQPSKEPPIRPERLKHPKYIKHDAQIESLLFQLDIGKLKALYTSICRIDLLEHTAVLAVATWAFFESLTSICGRDGASFDSYLSASKLRTLGYPDRDTQKPLKEAIDRIAKYGNTTKHDDIAALFNGPQLYNDMERLTTVIRALIESALSAERHK